MLTSDPHISVACSSLPRQPQAGLTQPTHPGVQAGGTASVWGMTFSSQGRRGTMVALSVAHKTSVQMWDPWLLFTSPGQSRAHSQAWSQQGGGDSPSYQEALPSAICPGGTRKIQHLHTHQPEQFGVWSTKILSPPSLVFSFTTFNAMILSSFFGELHTIRCLGRT